MRNESSVTRIVNGRTVKTIGQIQTIRIETHGTTPIWFISSSSSMLYAVFSEFVSLVGCGLSSPSYSYFLNDFSRVVHLPNGRSPQCALQ